MTAPRPSWPLPRQDSAKAQAEWVLGPRTAKRLATFGDGVLFVEARAGVQFLAWLVDFVVFVFGVAVGFVVLAGVGQAVNLDDGVMVLILLALLFLVPLLYGLCYRNGRALGAVLTGTQLVRVADGGRIGGKAPWAMLVRTILMPLLLFVVIAGALAGGGVAPGGSQVRISVDVGATGRLRAAGLTR